MQKLPSLEKTHAEVIASYLANLKDEAYCMILSPDDLGFNTEEIPNFDEIPFYKELAVDYALKFLTYPNTLEHKVAFFCWTKNFVIFSREDSEWGYFINKVPRDPSLLISHID